MTACEAPVEEGPTGSDSAAVESPQAAEAEAPAEAKGPPHARHPGKHGMHGPMAIFRQALDELELTDAQRGEIDKLLEELRPDGDAERPDQGFHDRLAAAVRTGTIDDALVTSHVEEVKRHLADKREAMTEAVQKLHALLTAEQRTALASKMRGRMAEMGPPGMGPHEMGPPDDMADAPERFGKGMRGDHPGKGMRGDHPGKGMRGDRFGKGGPLGHLLKDLDLTEEQRDKLRETLEANRPERPDPEAMKARHLAMKTHMEAMLTAFASDRFDAAALAPDFEPPMLEHVGKKVEMLRLVLPILDEEQRSALADRIAEGKLGHPKGWR